MGLLDLIPEIPRGKYLQTLIQYKENGEEVLRQCYIDCKTNMFGSAEGIYVLMIRGKEVIDKFLTENEITAMGGTFTPVSQETIYGH